MPADLSTWAQVANMNLADIDFDNFEEAIHSLATLPNLQSLYINLFEESQVDHVMRLLPDIDYLNGLPVDREALNESMQSSS